MSSRRSRSRHAGRCPISAGRWDARSYADSQRLRRAQRPRRLPFPEALPPPPAAAISTAASSVKPVVPAGIEEYVMPGDAGTPVEYEPVLYGAARVQYTDTKRGIDVTRDLQALVAFVTGPIPVDWDRAEAAPSRARDAHHTTATPARHLCRSRRRLWTRHVMPPGPRSSPSGSRARSRSPSTPCRR